MASATASQLAAAANAPIDPRNDDDRAYARIPADGKLSLTLHHAVESQYGSPME